MAKKYIVDLSKAEEAQVRYQVEIELSVLSELNWQSQEFADLPEVMQAIQQLWHQRWQELSQASA